jgi:hypothetical protein
MDFATVAKTLIEAIEELKIPYFVGGSLASGARGIPRSTLDVDLIIEMTPRRAVLLASSLGPDWYLDVDMARSALEHNRAFNIIHMLSSYRFDLFPAYTGFHASELKRATREPLRFPGGEVPCFVASAEDTILSKLQWYREGGEVSERQWSDIAGVFAITGNLDHDYLAGWAKKLGVSDLLDRAIKMTVEPI